MPRKLTPTTEEWLRQRIPIWGTMRDHAVAAGLIEPEAPALSEDQAMTIAEIRERTLAALATIRFSRKPANDKE